MRDDLKDISTKLAAALLVEQGSISLSDIEVLPLVRSHAEAVAIAEALVEVFDARVSHRSQGTVLELKRPASGAVDTIPVLPALTPEQFQRALRRVSRRLTTAGQARGG